MWRQCLDFPHVSAVKNLPANVGDVHLTQGWEDALGRKRQPTPVFLPVKSHGQRSLVGTVRGVTKESDTT